MRTTIPARFTEWTQLFLRLVVGFGFAAHGNAKLARGPEGFAAILLALHVPAPHFMAWATALLEFFGGLGVMAGAFVPLLALPLSVILLTAALTVHLPYGYSSVRLTAVTPAGAQFGPIGYELDLLYFAALVTVAFAGPGPFSLDGWRLARQPASRR